MSRAQKFTLADAVLINEAAWLTTGIAPDSTAAAGSFERMGEVLPHVSRNITVIDILADAVGALIACRTDAGLRSPIYTRADHDVRSALSAIFRIRSAVAYCAWAAAHPDSQKQEEKDD